MISLLEKNGFKSSIKTSSEREWALKDPLHGPVLSPEGSRAGGVAGQAQEQVAALQLGCPLLSGQPSLLDNHCHTQGHGGR